MVKKQIFTTIKFWAGLLFAQFLLFYIFSKSEFFINLFSHLFEVKKNLHQSLFSEIPFSVGDLFYLLFIIYFIFVFIKIIRNKSRKFYVKTLLISINIFYFIYQILWGMLYFQIPLKEKLPQGKATEAEIKTLVSKYITLCNNDRNALKEDKNGVFIIENLNQTKSSILKAQTKIPEIFLNKSLTNIDDIKPTFFGKLMNYTGILGYYNPFSGEAQYNNNLPSTFIPFTLAHESAHQIGFAREQEANFIAYLISKNSQDKEIEYSCDLYVLKSLLNSLQEKNPVYVKMSLKSLNIEVQRDLKNDKEFNENYSGIVRQLFYFSNDLFLKSNQQDGNVTYSYFVDLLVRYERNLKNQ